MDAPQRQFRTVIGIAFLFLLATPTKLLATGHQRVYDLALGCYAVTSPATGNTLQKRDGFYTFRSGGTPAGLFFKPAALSEYLLSDPDGQLLASLLPASQIAVGSPSRAAEWRIDPASNGQFRLTNRLTGTPLAHSYWKTQSWFWGWFKTRTLHTETSFSLTPRQDCRHFTEMTTNVRGPVTALRGDASQPIRGVIDAHTHISSYEFMGGKVMHGDPFHRWGVAVALQDSKVIHGPDGSLDIIGNLYKYGDLSHRYDTRGWPDFPWWPNHEQLTHSGYYYKWIERAWLGGLRIMVTDLVENEVLCNVQSTINPAGWINANSCNTMDSIRLQAQRMFEMQDYIDAQSGGPGKGFFRIVTSAQQARDVIADGKLAVVLGVEASETFNCGVRDYCSIAKLEDGLNELYRIGVRSIFPTHKFDNQISGSHVEDGFINIGQALATGYFFETKECDADTRGRHFSSGFPLLRDIPVVRELLAQTGAGPDYDESIQHCNTHGLSDLGVYLVNRMIDLNMVIELDHASTDAVTAIMDIVEARGYSGVVSSHSWMHSNKSGGVHKNTQRMIAAGGFVAPYNSDANDMSRRVERYLDEVETSGFLPGVGLGSDMAGLGGQAGPRTDAGTDPLLYPFTSEFGLVFDKQVAGNRVFDLNKDGVAQYGMIADHIQDIRERATPRVYNALMNSAEAYLQMWERAESNLNAQYIDPLAD